MPETGWSIFELDNEYHEGRKWLIGAFATGRRHSNNVEIGYAKGDEGWKPDQLHYHKVTEEIYVVLSGWMRIEIDSMIYRIRRGQVLYVRPMVPHKVISVQDGAVWLLVKAPSIPDDKVIAEE